MTLAITLLSAALLSGIGLSEGGAADSQRLREVRDDAARGLVADLAEIDAESVPEFQAALITAAARRGILILDGHSRLEDRFQAATLMRPDAALSTLKSILGALQFEFVREAEVPVGFPEPTLVGEIEMKSYPAYRLARASMGARGMVQDNLAFWTLFRHIEKNSIPMTAPVEMSYGDPSNKKARTESMAFLYSSSDVGKLGADGSVEVIDVPPAQVVSLGVRGDSNSSRIAAVREALLEWVGNNDSYEVAGDLRVLGYNGPSVRGNRRYFEVQIPIKLAGRAEWL